MKAIIAIIVALWALTSPAAGASDPGELARKAAESLGEAHLALGKATRAGDRVAALTQTIRAFEDGLDALRQGLRRAAMREAALKREFDSESEKVAELLAILISIQSSSGPLALLHPTGPLGTARSGMIVSDITPAIQKRANTLRANLEEAALLQALQESAADTLKQGLTGVQKARTLLSQAISNRTDLPKRFLTDTAQLQSLIDSSETLDGFASGLAGLADVQPSAGGEGTFQTNAGTLPLPVTGALLRAFSEADAAGVKRPGLLIATRPKALVTTPWPATLRYSGPLLDYGNVIILEPDAGVLLVLAGMNQVYGVAGQVLNAGAAIGLMGGLNPDPDGFYADALSGTGSAATETLYIELRLGDKPVDPAPWFAQTKE